MMFASFSAESGSGSGREILVQHLLVKEDDVKLLLELQQRISGGEDLSDLAVEYSICPSKDEGGMLGWERKGQMGEKEEGKKCGDGEVEGKYYNLFGYVGMRDEEEEGWRELEGWKD
ncbi:hypothetical protein TIFTF001_044703 [Ficus carica]|uniref:Peptidyl-prolyl cis-trans isomerase n=1 Tax=Ficus carica TaxID=3494 RepID=A0AA87ZEY9_FICCA|nr:hypothetical protein TIFTF001_044703 [Ficus carica]